ncbi:hypothetical protein OG384_11425 [Streptomyces sp. NBC_01324]|uniref:hypothetical protein n=1 Tax=Streptomyces sp. NBC_01324 TaxID=2903826 RepID=UPI002E1353F4|nr:hypothetical protein OG384_11425 [Streptomyces sp. NBC_01324]
MALGRVRAHGDTEAVHVPGPMGGLLPPVLTAAALPHPSVHLGDFDVDEERDGG